jgi:hypothetical protein
MLKSGAVNLAAMTHRDYEDRRVLIFNMADDAIVADPVSPKTGNFPAQRFAVLAWIFRWGDPFAQGLNGRSARPGGRGFSRQRLRRD